MTRRSRWWRAARARGLAGIVALGTVGCHWLPIHRVDATLDPRRLGPTGQPFAPASRPAPGPAARPESVAGRDVPRPNGPLRPISDREAVSAGPAAAASPSPTPLLDAALARAQLQQRAAIETTAAPMPATLTVPKASSPPAGSPPPAPEPARKEETRPEPTAPEAPASTGPAAEPPPKTTADTTTPSGSHDRQEPTTPPADDRPTATAGPDLKGHRFASGDGPTPPGAAEPCCIVVHVGRPGSDAEWAWCLSRLREIAHHRAAESETNGIAPVWDLRARLLTWMAESDPEHPAAQHAQHPLWPVALSLLAEASSNPGDARDAAPGDLDLHAAALALEARAPLAIAALQFCHKVRSFGNFEPLAADRLRAGQVVTIYCEMVGLRYEPGPKPGEPYRSHLASALEIRPASGGEPLWTLDLGTAEDLCRLPRRDYYVNYRVSLPGPETLPPGSYRLRLIQKDTLGGQGAAREAPFTIVADGKP